MRLYTFTIGSRKQRRVSRIPDSTSRKTWNGIEVFANSSDMFLTVSHPLRQLTVSRNLYYSCCLSISIYKLTFNITVFQFFSFGSRGLKDRCKRLNRYYRPSNRLLLRVVLSVQRADVRSGFPFSFAFNCTLSVHKLELSAYKTANFFRWLSPCTVARARKPSALFWTLHNHFCKPRDVQEGLERTQLPS